MKDCSTDIADSTLSAATIVHKKLGPGLLESIYQQALVIELEKLGLSVKQHVEVPVHYDGINLGIGFRADIIIEDSLLLEIKSVDEFHDIHVAQITTYLKLLGVKRGFLINFNKKQLKHGIKRVSI